MEPLASDPKLRKLLRNMAYVGVLARLLSIEPAEVEAAIGRVFGKKARARELNLAAARAGLDGPPASRSGTTSPFGGWT